MTEKEIQEFYRSKEWRVLRIYKLSNNPLCEICSTKEIPVPAAEVHHLKEVRDVPELRLSLSNLQSLCKRCHTRITFGVHDFVKSSDLKVYNKKWKL